MRPVKVVLVTVLAGTISIGAAIFGQRWIGESPLIENLTDRNTDRLETLPDFRLLDLDGREVTSNAWAGKTLILHFWATWCPSCISEMPMLIRAQEALRESGVQFVGIAVDSVEDVKDFVVDHPINYPVLIADSEVIALSKRLGNRLEVLPFTVIFDARGRRVYSQIGDLQAEALRAEVDRATSGKTRL
ncbi:TlpA family protein disulfide reductase [Thiocystis violacea]|uniref:TlpA family protein disulfide reductase n=1 Tax=Thiocystis violacea TaxID=13725 RepID=UPI001905ECB6|nr:TlpA disulfide reductase family protein [Thiocystis violacea]MBK1723551.1 alkyl hydroperoxide reductase [Thiocystis violacea]